MDNLEEHRSGAAAIIDAVKALSAPELMKFEAPDGTTLQMLLHPSGKTLVNLEDHLDKLRARPKRRIGIHRALSLDSFIEIVNRFKDGNSAIFASNDPQKPSLTGIFDFHEAGPAAETGKLARHGEHACLYAFPLSKEWQAWHKGNKSLMNQADFAAFIEDRIADVSMPDPVLTGALNQRIAGGDFGEKTQIEELAELLIRLNAKLATPAELVTLSRGLAIYENAVAKNIVNLQTGEAQIKFETAHVDEQGAPLNIPGYFLIAIPVFELGPLYQVAVRLRYRKQGGQLGWFYELYRIERVFDFAFQGACVEAAAQTEVPLYLGAVKA
jgi:hypothetical protein